MLGLLPAADRPQGESKACRACGETKPGDDFCRYTRAADGLQARCGQCYTQYFKLWSAQRRLAKRPDVGRRKVCGICGEEKRAEVRPRRIPSPAHWFPRMKELLRYWLGSFC